MEPSSFQGNTRYHASLLKNPLEHSDTKKQNKTKSKVQETKERNMRARKGGEKKTT